MPLVQQAGGSLTTAVILTLLAWGVRMLRKDEKDGVRIGTQDGPLIQGRFFSTLSAAALRMLVETNPVPHLLIDLRDSEEVAERPLPRELSFSALNLPTDELDGALLGNEAAWPTRLQEKASPPTKDYILVFIGTDEAQARQAASKAAQKGFQRTAVLNAGLNSFSQQLLSQANLKFINRDALAVMMELSREDSLAYKPFIIDLRRYDELSLYGSVTDTQHLPADEASSAFQMTGKQWKEKYRIDKPGRNDVVVLLCRTNKRACWVAQIAHDNGLQRCYVYKQGIYGWHMSPAVRSYRSYEKWDPPPEPEPVQTLGVDIESGRTELSKLGLL